MEIRPDSAGSAGRWKTPGTWLLTLRNASLVHQTLAGDSSGLGRLVEDHQRAISALLLAGSGITRSRRTWTAHALARGR
jgi:hypothetical protein